MLNHQQNEQLVKDKLFLERVFLLEIEEADRLFVEQNLEPLSTKSNHRSFFKLGLLLIYAVLIILLSSLSSPFENQFSTLPASLEEANNKAIVNELPSSEAQSKRQSLESEIAKHRERQSPTFLSTSNNEISSNSEEKDTRQAADLVLESLPPSVPKVPLATSNAEISSNSEIEEILQADDLVLEQLPPLPVPEVPLSTSKAEIPIRQVVEELEDESLSSSIEPKPQLQINPETELETPKVTVTEESEPMDGWLGVANVVYHSSISDPSEAEEQINTPVSDNIEQTDHSLNEDLRQYLTSTPLSSQSKSSPVSVAVESQPQPEEKEQIEAELAEVTVTEASETELASPTEERPLFADEDLKKYLTSTPLYPDDVLKQRLIQ